MDVKRHWETIYRAKDETEVSWFQPEARLSLELIRGVVAGPHAAVLDAGGGASRLVDGLLQLGFSDLTVVDISAAALEQARSRLGSDSERVRWREEDLLEASFETDSVDLWHDRAVFHFLTDPTDRRRYVEQVRRAVRPGGHVLIATFAHDGPTRCSGLEVTRYTPEGLQSELGEEFDRIRSAREEHTTPSGGNQSFLYGLFRYRPPGSERSGYTEGAAGRAEPSSSEEQRSRRPGRGVRRNDRLREQEARLLRESAHRSRGRDHRSGPFPSEGRSRANHARRCSLKVVRGRS